MSVRRWWFSSSSSTSSAMQALMARNTLGGTPTPVTKGPTG